MKRIIFLILFVTTTLFVTADKYEVLTKRITMIDGLPSLIVYSIWQDKEGYMWFLSPASLARYDGYQFRIFPKNHAKDIPLILEDYKTKDAEYVQTSLGSLERRGRDGSVQSWQLVPLQVVRYTKKQYFHVDDLNENTEAISTYGGGLYFYDKITKTLTKIHEVGDNALISNMYIDRTGCLWLGEANMGVVRVKIGSLRYKQIMLEKNPLVQGDNDIRFVNTLGGSSVVVSNDNRGLYTCDMVTMEPKLLCHTDAKMYSFQNTNMSETPLWFASRTQGIWRVSSLNDLREGKYEEVKGIPSSFIYDMYKAKDGDMWAATLNFGLVHVHEDSVIERYMQNKHLHDLQQDNAGNWWVAAEDSLYLLSPDKQGKLRVRDKKPGYFVVISQDDEGNVWTGGIGTGLLRCKARKGRIESKAYTMQNGLVNNNIFSVVQDLQGNIWAGTEQGLTCLNDHSNYLKNFQITSSLLANSFSERSAICLPNGHLLFGSHNGLIEVVPQNKADMVKPETKITSLLVNGVETEQYDNFDYTQNNITFFFSNFQYSMLTSVSYQHKLDGVDKNWSDTWKDNSVTYKQLAPGKYTFRVRSTNGSGIWGEETTLTFTIHQPWWNSWWAWILYVLLITTIVVIVFTIARRILRLHKQLDVERRISAFKMDFYDRIQRELRNPLNVLQGATENVQVGATSKSTVRNIRRGSSRMLKLMDMIQQFHHLSDVEMQVKAEQAEMNADAELRFKEIQQAIREEENEYREMAPPPINQQTILIMESDEDNLLHLTDNLRKYFKVVECPDYNDVMMLLAQYRPSLSIIDISRDRKELIELTRRLNKEYPEMPIIHLSSDKDDERHLQSLKAGASEYFVKPFSVKVLVESIAKVLNRRMAEAASVTQEGQSPALLTDLKDKKFLDKFQLLLNSHISEENFSVEQFAEMMGLGRTQFYKKVKALTGETPVTHLHRARINHAANLLTSTHKTVEEVMYSSGFRNPSHFYNSFRKQFGMSPKDYRETHA